MHTDKLTPERPLVPHGRRKSLWKGPALAAALLLVPPLLGSYFIKDWHWHPGAFVVLGVILFSLGLIYQLITWKRDSLAYRAAVALSFVTGFGLTWGSLVQSFDVNRDAAFYFVVPVVGIIGASLARLRPEGMARVLFVTALTEIAVMAAVFIRLYLQKPELFLWTLAEWRGFAGNAMNALLFAVSALLFRKAAREERAIL